MHDYTPTPPSSYPPLLGEQTIHGLPVELVVTPGRSDSVRMSAALCADLRYWIDDFDSADTAEQTYLRLPGIPGYLEAVPDDTLELTEIEIPESMCRQLGLYTLPATLEFLVVPPSSATQLARFES